ncbi:terpene cyclase/mutase family protein [Telmatocola sphagniphila]|uniref:Terpene cyclase/mutase family protein n=1 Tax=Telmatocola sphagniphila TaxID=1123043 RepID=A0A8E6BAE3_9BACT|nr:prenyltransferase/squalene oxidase repeat-containing protein [Telmatocola sphagniphila]QVL34723.1 terpene cyclase/mutase family protein [Telmatocola sphagniphila]
MFPIRSITVGFLAVFCLGPIAVRAEEIKAEQQAMIDRGLKWLASTQSKGEGNWEANGGQYPTTMTALAGMCFLMEGSTLREGKYSPNLRRAVEWFMKRSQPSGLLGNPNNPTESSRYMYGHGFGLLFLASVYGEEEDERRRKDLERMLTKAVEYCGKAQTDRGGWGYVSASEGGNFDEGSVTITQLQGLRAARNAGIVVPKSIIDKAVKYLKDCTTSRGGIIYSLATGSAVSGQERPALTAAAVSCAFSSGDYSSDYAKKWIKYCKESIPVGKGRLSHDEYQSYYFAQAVYILGDDGYERLFPGSKKDDQLSWTKYKEAMFDYLKAGQSNDGSWSSGYIGNVFTTTVNLTILQLDKATLPIYQR